MSKNIKKSTIQQAKDFLQIDDELSSIELLHLLKDHRKRIHPDRFPEENAKKEAEEKVKMERDIRARKRANQADLKYNAEHLK